MACAIYKAGSDKIAVPYCALGEAVHFNPRKMLKMWRGWRMWSSRAQTSAVEMKISCHWLENGDKLIEEMDKVLLKC